jgi:predicted nucleotidyltransferase
MGIMGSMAGSTDVESSDMDVVVELGVPGASEGVRGSGVGKRIEVGAAVDMIVYMYYVYGYDATFDRENM